MKHIKRFKLNLLLSFLAISVCLISCEEDHSPSLIDLTLSLESEAQTKSSRDISPTADELTISRFEITLIDPNGKTINLNTTTNSKKLENLVKGKYEISAIGYNKSDKPIVEGSNTYYLFNSESTVKMNLSYISGKGNICLNFNWNKNQADEDLVGVVATFSKLVGGSYIPVDVIYNSNNVSLGKGCISAELDSGYYIVSAKLMNGPLELSGLAEQLVVLSGHTTNGDSTFIIGDTSVDYSISFSCSTYLPIKGSIEASPASIIEGQNLNLKFTPTSGLEGYPDSAINYKWYFEGSLIEGETTNQLSILPVEGQHRYDLFAYVDGQSGALGSAKISVTCSPNAL